jgi:inosine-uridine nucleoside N-ribohydrolase
MTRPQSRVRLWVDTDIGDNPDDAIALAVAARHPQVDLVGVSTVGGDADRRAQATHEVLGAAGTTAVVSGNGPLELPDDVDALLASGPLTNVAATLAAGRRLPDRVAMMGGALRDVEHRGLRHHVEHNFGADPDAAAAVVGAVDGLVLVPLDVTARLTVDDEQARRLAIACPELAPAIERWQRDVGWPLCLHDPFALLVLLGATDGLGVVTEDVALRVDETGAVHVDDDLGAPRSVVRDVDARRAVERILLLAGSTPEGD